MERWLELHALSPPQLDTPLATSVKTMVHILIWECHLHYIWHGVIIDA